MPETNNDLGIMPLDRLRAVKEDLGPVECIEIKESTLTAAHQRLGEAVKESLGIFLEHKLEKTNQEECGWQRELTAGFLAHLRIKQDNPVIGKKVKEYLATLEAWAKGAGIEEHSRKLKFEFGSALELALWLQNDNVGCITVMVPTKENSVLVMHTEEEELEREASRKPKIAVMEVDGKKFYSYVYPDLMPGSAFSWDNEGRFMASDALYLKAGEAKGLANIAVWMLMFSDKSFEKAEEIIRELGPYHDGYAVNLVNRNQLKKIIFAHDQMENVTSGQQDGLIQVNILGGESGLSELEEIEPDKRQGYQRRQTFLKRLFDRIHRNKLINLNVFTRLLSFRSMGEEAISSPWVRAAVAAEIGEQSSTVRVFAGPALKSEAKSGSYREFKVRHIEG